MKHEDRPSVYLPIFKGKIRPLVEDYAKGLIGFKEEVGPVRTVSEFNDRLPGKLVGLYSVELKGPVGRRVVQIQATYVKKGMEVELGVREVLTIWNTIQAPVKVPV